MTRQSSSIGGASISIGAECSFETSASAAHAGAEYPRGVTIVICCFNSRSRLPATLEHLARQRVSPDLQWEVIVVDNGSTDGTADLAVETWKGSAIAPLRVVPESEPGLTAARFRGIREARYPIVSFLDDDNHVCGDWVRLVDEVMSNHPEAGACGGYSFPSFEADPPGWFSEHQRQYAVGPQAEVPGDITDVKGVLWGAGLSVRRSAMLRLLDLGFRPLLSDRRGESLSSGGDYEICLALRLLGYRLIYDPRLELEHFLPTSRMQWSYLRRLSRESAASRVRRDPYHFLLEPHLRAKPPWWRSWPWQAAAAIRPILRHPFRFLLSLAFDLPGDPVVPRLDSALGRFTTLVRERREYSARIRALEDAPWLASAAAAPGGSRRCSRPPADPGVAAESASG
jgi:hypothetical protein